MNAGQLKEALVGVPDDMEVVVLAHDVRTEVTRNTTTAEIVGVDSGYVTTRDAPRAELKFLVRVP